MAGIDWNFIWVRLLRHYYIVFFMIPALLLMTHTDKRTNRISSARIHQVCFLLVILAVSSVFEDWFMSLPGPPLPWRTLTSAIGYSIRPFCMLPLLFDSSDPLFRSRKRRLLFSLPAWINLLINFSAFFVPLAFYFTEDNSFGRGPLNLSTVYVTVFYMIVLSILAIRYCCHSKDKESLALILICAACLGAAILEMTGTVFPVPLLNQTIAFSMVFYYLLKYRRYSGETIDNLTHSVLLMQIRPHFVNNCLSVIRGLIRTDTDRAADALNYFSSYLQDTMNMVSRQQMIPLSQEMQIIDSYLHLEQIRFNNSFVVEKDLIEEDFPVPPLTIQPLVENAVRHGLRSICHPGHLLIRTRKDDREYTVTIADNGCGFDPKQVPSDVRPHIGLKNVTSRLNMMCRGKLTILSGPTGTQVTVHIPIQAKHSQFRHRSGQKSAPD